MGAGLCCVRIHKALLEQGISSKVLVLHKRFNDPDVYQFERSTVRLPIFIRWPITLCRLILRKLHIPTTRLQVFQNKLDRLRDISPPFYTLPFSDSDLHSHPLVLDADVIHLHWVAGFLDYPSFFKNVDKPVVWTLHDENLYLGGFHYRTVRDKHFAAYEKLEANLIQTKAKCLSLCRNLTLVCLSEQMLELSLASEVTNRCKHEVIHNMVDHRIFRPFDKGFCRSVFGLPQNKRLLLFVSYYLNDRLKGLSELVSALEKLDLPETAMFAIGIGMPEFKTSVQIHYPGLIDDQRLLALAYSACDLFVMPSFQEAFAQTPLEALACGLPVVAFPCSGTRDLIRRINGVRADDFTTESLKRALLEALDIDYHSNDIRQDVIERFGALPIVGKYIEVYQKSITSAIA